MKKKILITDRYKKTEIEKVYADMKKNKLNDLMYHQIKCSGIPLPLREQVIIPDRKYIFDFFWPQFGKQTAFWLEVDGGQWMPKGGHNSGTGMRRDREKDIAAFFENLKGFRVTGDMVEDGTAIAAVVKFFKGTK